MPKITSNVLIAVSSSMPSIDSDYAIFVSSSNLYLASASAVQQLNLDTGYFRLLEYTGSAVTGSYTTYTYHRNPLVKLVRVLAVGAGGAGGGGATCNGTAVSATGASGGSGAGLVIVTFASQSLTSDVYQVLVPGATRPGSGSTSVTLSGT